MKVDSKRDDSTTQSRICYVAPDVPIPSPRGSSVHVLELAKSLSRFHEVHVICRRTSSNEPRSENFDGLILHRVYRFLAGPGRHAKEVAGRSASEAKHGLSALVYRIYLRTLFALYVSFLALRVISKNSIDEIIERESSFGAGGLASLYSGKPLILEVVGPRYSRISVWRSKKILYYTESMLQKWVNKSKCVRVSGAVNLSLFRKDEQLREILRKRIGFSQDQIVIGYIGTFQDWHGIDTLLQSIKELRGDQPKLRLLLIGPFYEKYEAISKTLGLEDICFFAGPIEYQNVVGYINACDIMVALYEPGKNELRKQYGIGAPLKILEYMACGKPVISTNVKLVDEVVKDGDSGYLVEPGNKEDLVLAVSKLLKDGSKIDLFGRNGMDFVNKGYSWDSLANLIESMF